MTKNPLQPKDPQVPGIGMAGMVMCPFGFQRSPCMKNGCEMWMELYYNKQPVGRCSLAWPAKLMVELREAVDKLGGIDATIKKGSSAPG
jgi:hypothetical protein